MIHAKNYESAFKFAKVMPKILWLLFSGHGVYVLDWVNFGPQMEKNNEDMHLGITVVFTDPK